MNKLKVWMLAGLAVLLLVVGIGIPVMAADPTPTPTPTPAVKEGSLIDRVAKIIGVTPEKLIEAMKAAATELRGATPTPTPGTPKITRDAYLEKVAEKLGVAGVTKDTLTAAFTQATKELQTERIETALQKAVEKGLITDAEKKQIEDWYNQRPAALDKIGGFGFGFGWGRFCKPWGWGRGGNPKASIKRSNGTTSGAGFNLRSGGYGSTTPVY